MAILTLAATGCLLAPAGGAKSESAARQFPGEGSRGEWLKANRYYNEGLSAFRSKKYERAASYFKRACRTYDKDFAYFENLAVVEMEQHKLDDARADCERALKLNPKGYANQHNLCLILTQQHKYKEALAGIETALSMKGKNQNVDDLLKLRAALEKAEGQ